MIITILLIVFVIVVLYSVLCHMGLCHKTWLYFVLFYMLNVFLIYSTSFAGEQLQSLSIKRGDVSIWNYIDFFA